MEKFGDVWCYPDLHFYTVGDEPSIGDVLGVVHSGKHTKMEQQRAQALRFLLENISRVISDSEIANKVGWGDVFVEANISPVISNVNTKSSYLEIIQPKKREPGQPGLYQIGERT